MDLNQITLPCRDLAASIRFYCQLGCTQIVDSPEYARFESPAGRATFSLHYVAELAADTGVVVYFETSRLDALVAELKDKGIQFDSEPADQRWLWREARLRDPASNVICLYYAGENRRNPPWRINK